MSSTPSFSYTLAAAPALVLALIVVPACSGDLSAGEAAESGFDSSGGTGTTQTGSSETGLGTDTDTGTDSDPAGSTDGESDSDNATEGATGDGDGAEEPEPPADCEVADCGPGECIEIDDVPYCVCPEGTDWGPWSCETCALVDAANDHAIEVEVLPLSGRFTVNGSPPPANDFDDANMWLENTSTRDRVFIGNTHDELFSVRVTPGIYDLVYESESPGATMPLNPHIVLRQVPVFESIAGIELNIPVELLEGDITLNGGAPPDIDFDDANIFLRDPNDASGTELLAGSTRNGAYSVRAVPGTYELIYRHESPGPIMPRNDGAVLALHDFAAQPSHPIDIISNTLSGSFLINGNFPPDNDFDDANIGLESAVLGQVPLGNTHDQSYEVEVIAGDYNVLYMHESGTLLPQNQRAAFDQISSVNNPPAELNVTSVSLAGNLTLNNNEPPSTEFDDGVIHLYGSNSDDHVVLANTHDGSYQIQLVPGTYDVFYSHETAGGTVPENTKALLMSEVAIDVDDTLDVDVQAVPLSGAFTLGNEVPPSSVYEDGRIFLRNTQSKDTVLLGSTHEGGYATVVVPGTYEVYYVQETGGDVPSNQNAFLGMLDAQDGMMPTQIDIPVVDLLGAFFQLAPENPDSPIPVPTSPTDGGQLYLRAANGDVVLLGDSTASNYSAKLVSGTYGVYYRSEASETMPENDNGRIACITVE